jgi:hypothetical protein
MSVATILILSAIGVAIPALTPAPAFAIDDNTNYNTDDNTNYNTDDNTDDNNHDILLFLIDVVECFTNNDEEFSDDVQLCLYGVIDDYFDNVDNNLNNDNDGRDYNNNNNNDDYISSNDNNNNGTSSQET